MEVDGGWRWTCVWGEGFMDRFRWAVFVGDPAGLEFPTPANRHPRHHEKPHTLNPAQRRTFHQDKDVAGRRSRVYTELAVSRAGSALPARDTATTVPEPSG
ncbi:hypothetical protein GCM10007147_08260 [Nocardiopsis kunsanensis]|uniref:Uncharacterized protein n=1 Tax=Nocardiopsis kunsanensis TaxID=141693 RepID=A0A919CGE5_9ACTN|nr:hypothetical protein GCM10007147_08260 [Nocardiopsis kunsanensis]